MQIIDPGMENTDSRLIKPAYQVSIRKTIPVTLQDLWNYMLSYEGIKLWIGYTGPIIWKRGEKYTKRNGTDFCVRVFKELSHVRVTYTQREWPNISTIQMKFVSSKTGTTISFHQEKLLDEKQQIAMRYHWEKIIAMISKHFK